MCLNVETVASSVPGMCLVQVEQVQHGGAEHGAPGDCCCADEAALYLPFKKPVPFNAL